MLPWKSREAASRSSSEASRSRLVQESSLQLAGEQASSEEQLWTRAMTSVSGNACGKS